MEYIVLSLFSSPFGWGIVFGIVALFFICVRHEVRRHWIILGKFRDDRKYSAGALRGLYPGELGWTTAFHLWLLKRRGLLRSWIEPEPTHFMRSKESPVRWFKASPQGDVRISALLQENIWERAGERR